MATGLYYQDIGGDPLGVGHSCGFGRLNGSGGRSGGQQSFVVGVRDVSAPRRRSVSSPTVVMYWDREGWFLVPESFVRQLLINMLPARRIRSFVP
jgi:hypothetical protein